MMRRWKAMWARRCVMLPKLLPVSGRWTTLIKRERAVAVAVIAFLFAVLGLARLVAGQVVVYEVYRPTFAPAASTVYEPVPVTTYKPVTVPTPVTTYRPFTSYLPTTTYSPVVTYEPATVVAPAYVPTVVVRPAFVPGEPVRNVFRALLY